MQRSVLLISQRKHADGACYSEGWGRPTLDDTAMISRRLNPDSRRCVVEIAGNDGYLLRPFTQRRISALGLILEFDNRRGSLC